ncbi:hypothetical protein CEUSTIGMA_g10475.t1 [Chlamydomonas eustigma]|uniref:Uncharacterized protein n=1 Tax=Chlamydomonas eustigma TaxID=1157962 RepID=A0A250XJF4_9CHLO|nr:hypothetical protein CEUSTIGMA_g10475.t1 [Chlamydomonas eustigma]|eukprot:GAX83049.1 hypothetical protein CEUSTIGMA_g10475.t1 [Chlamydomonas eustigma]
MTAQGFREQGIIRWVKLMSSGTSCTVRINGTFTLFFPTVSGLIEQGSSFSCHKWVIVWQLFFAQLINKLQASGTLPTFPLPNGEKAPPSLGYADDDNYILIGKLSELALMRIKRLFDEEDRGGHYNQPPYSLLPSTPACKKSGRAALVKYYPKPAYAWSREDWNFHKAQQNLAVAHRQRVLEPRLLGIWDEMDLDPRGWRFQREHHEDSETNAPESAEERQQVRGAGYRNVGCADINLVDMTIGYEVMQLYSGTALLKKVGFPPIFCSVTAEDTSKRLSLHIPAPRFPATVRIDQPLDPTLLTSPAPLPHFIIPPRTGQGEQGPTPALLPGLDNAPRTGQGGQAQHNTLRKRLFASHDHETGPSGLSLAEKRFIA